MIVTIIKSLAVICFSDLCEPALVGEDTPLGEYSLNKRQVLSDGYGGNVLQFKIDGNLVYAIHRPFTNDKKRDRVAALNSPIYFRTITKGCINVSDKTYDLLYKQSHKITVRIID